MKKVAITILLILILIMPIKANENLKESLSTGTIQEESGIINYIKNLFGMSKIQEYEETKKNAPVLAPSSEALCKQITLNDPFLINCDVSAWNLIKPGRSYVWKFWLLPNDSTSRSYKIIGGTATQRSYSAPGKYFYQLTISDGTVSSTITYGPHAIDIVAEDVRDDEENPPENPEPEIPNITSEFELSSNIVGVNEWVTLTAKQEPLTNLVYRWEFSDGSVKYGKSISSYWSSPGIIDFKLEIYEQRNNQQTTPVSSGWHSITIKKPTLQRLSIVQENLGENLGVGVSNGVAWVLGRKGFITVNVVDKNSPEFGKILAKSTEFNSRATTLAVSDNLVAVGAGSQGIFLFNASDPKNLSHISTKRFLANPLYNLAYPIVSLAFDEKYLIVGLSNGFRILDISNPSNPLEIKEIRGITPRSLFVNKDTLFIGKDHPPGLEQYTSPASINNPANDMLHKGFISTYRTPKQIDLDNDLLAINQQSYMAGDISFHNVKNNFERIATEGGQGSFYRGAGIKECYAFSTSPSNLVAIKLDKNNIYSASSIVASSPLGSGVYGNFIDIDERGLIFVGATNSALVIFKIEETSPCHPYQ